MFVRQDTLESLESKEEKEFYFLSSSLAASSRLRLKNKNKISSQTREQEQDYFEKKKDKTNHRWNSLCHHQQQDLSLFPLDTHSSLSLPRDSCCSIEEEEGEKHHYNQTSLTRKSPSTFAFHSTDRQPEPLPAITSSPCYSYYSSERIQEQEEPLIYSSFKEKNKYRKRMRLKERVVILCIGACCLLCVLFVIQSKVSTEDMMMWEYPKKYKYVQYCLFA